jgi:alkanesulfonate monooxygenase SsuD/methylene tetrahydromethanopterin reductase-like flavin-dependent oxidoreductase (luciferase family)
MKKLPGQENSDLPIPNRGVYPRPFQEKLPIWVAIGGTPESVVRAATLNLPMLLAIIGGLPDRFVPLTDLYRKAAKEAGNDPGIFTGWNRLPRFHRR